MMQPLPLLLRTVAIVIAVAAAIDPVITTPRSSDAVVAVIVSDAAADSALARRVVERVGQRLQAVAGPWPGAAATVVVGSGLPAGGIVPGAPLFAVLPEAPPVRIAALQHARRVPPDALASVRLEVDVQRAGAVQLRLLRDGTVLDAVDTVMAAPGTLHGSLSFAPAETGFARLRVEARGAGGYNVARDVVLEVVPQRWRVLFHDGRPSWQSTFVRRTLEQDPRFAVTARVATSRGIATDFGSAVPPLTDARGTAGLDAIVVGAPETLSAGELAALERFMRQRGGAVLLLPDRAPEGAWSRLAGVSAWQGSDVAAVASLNDAGGSSPLRTSALAWPASLPAGARTVLTDNSGRPVVWRTALGAGTLVVSGALDSWQFRDPETSGFETFWPALLAELAGSTPLPFEAHASGVVAPGKWATLQVTVQGEPAGPVSAALEDGTPLELWPASEPGVLRGEFRAPGEPREYGIIVEGDAGILHIPLFVEERGSAGRDDRDLLAAAAHASGGEALDAGAASELPQLLLAALRSERAPQPWHPMRSPWWILPFVGVLGGEWWWRRRRALP